MRPFKLLIALSLPAVVVGCASVAVVHRDSPPELGSRLGAALEIQDTETRDEALGTIAWAAAESGNHEITVRALEAIETQEARDAATLDVVRRFADLGDYERAMALARDIRDPSVRDRAFSNIATGVR